MASRWTVSVILAKAGHRLGYASVFEVQSKAISYTVVYIRDVFVWLPTRTIPDGKFHPCAALSLITSLATNKA